MKDNSCQKNKRVSDAIRNKKDFVFLSSLLGNREDMREERCEIYEYINSKEELTPIYVDEIDNPRILTQIEQGFNEKFEIIDTLTYKIQNCKYLIIIFSKLTSPFEYNDHGSIIYNSEVSMWEIELFLASIMNEHQKPIYAIIESGFEEQNRPRLLKCLELIQLSSIKIFKNVSRKNFRTTIESIILSEPLTNSINLYKLISNLYTSSNSSLFCSPVERNSGKEINETLIETIISQTSITSNVQSNLSKLYIAYRELQEKAPYKRTIFKKYLSKWNIISSNFAGTLSWTGIWGHEILGVLYHLRDLENVRELLRNNSSDYEYKDIAPPHGAFASAYYSTAKLCTSNKIQQKMLFDVMLKYIALGLKENQFDKQGLLTIRGSYYIYTKNPLNFWRAAADFRDAYSIVKKNATEKSQLADIENHYALALFLTGRVFKAKELCKESLNKFESVEDSGAKARAYRKASIIFSYNRKKSNEYKKIAENISSKVGAWDQYRQIS